MPMTQDYIIGTMVKCKSGALDLALRPRPKHVDKSSVLLCNRVLKSEMLLQWGSGANPIKIFTLYGGVK